MFRWRIGAILLLGVLLLLGACNQSADGSLESLPAVTTLRQFDSAIVMTWQVWPEDERGAYFAQFAFDPDDDSRRVYRWQVNIQGEGECRTKWFDWSPVDDNIRFYCGRGVFLQPLAPAPGTLLPAPEIPETEEGWIRPARNASPDGVFALYVVPDEADPNSDQLRVLNTGSRQSAPITLPPGAKLLTTKWAPDGASFVAMVHYPERADWDVLRIYRADWRVETLDGVQITSSSRELSWSNDGASLLYGQADNKGAALWIYDFATDTAQQIFRFSNEENDIGVHAWSPDDQRIIFVSSFAATCRSNEAGFVSCGRTVHIIDRDGQNMRDLPELGEQDDLVWVRAQE